MRLEGKVIVVTGGANGIGRALVERFHKEAPAGLVVADIDEAAGKEVAADTEALFVPTNVREETEIQKLVEQTREAFGRIDVFCSNAGVLGAGGPEAPNEVWQRSWEVNFNPHVYAARAVLPEMLERREGYLLQTVSAAGLLSNPGAAPYTVTKHAALGFAEWLSITYGDRGVRVSCICPQTVRTNLIDGSEQIRDIMLGIAEPLEPEQVADAVIEGMEQEKFLILPHPEVAEFFRRKGDDYERWLRGMRRLNAKLMGEG
ncbi:MAG TPA: SDR family oxidoreductase [Actinomycetota bacterium]|nr:SDR family oxidoreductase [Actinomycetota bacterium]